MRGAALISPWSTPCAAPMSMLEKDAAGAPLLSASPDTPWRRKLVRLAFLAPDLQLAILEGRQPNGLNLTALMEWEIPPSWAEQRKVLGSVAAE